MAPEKIEAKLDTSSLKWRRIYYALGTLFFFGTTVLFVSMTISEFTVPQSASPFNSSPLGYPGVSVGSSGLFLCFAFIGVVLTLKFILKAHYMTVLLSSRQKLAEEDRAAGKH